MLLKTEQYYLLNIRAGKAGIMASDIILERDGVYYLGQFRKLLFLSEVFN